MNKPTLYLLLVLAFVAAARAQPPPSVQSCNTTNDCTGGSGPCVVDLECIDGVCAYAMAVDGTPCTPHDWCFTDGTCHWNECIPYASRDCSYLDDSCNVGVCNSNMESCVPEPLPQGTECEGPSGPSGPYSIFAACVDANICDGQGVCEVIYTPQGTICGEPEYPCEYPGICLGDDQDCEYPGNLPNSAPCTNGNFCTLNEYCLFGDCIGGVPRDCSEASDACNEGVCMENMDACVPTPLEQGTPCVSGLYSGLCLDAELCNGEGACEQHFKEQGTLCRQGDGTYCNPDEHCTGESSFCPIDITDQSPACLERPLSCPYHTYDHHCDDDEPSHHHHPPPPPHHDDHDDHHHSHLSDWWWVFLVVGLVALLLLGLYMYRRNDYYVVDDDRLPRSRESSVAISVESMMRARSRSNTSRRRTGATIDRDDATMPLDLDA